MILTDVCVLVAAYRDEHPEHSRCRHFLQTMLLGEESFGVSDLVLSGFLRIVTSPRIFARPSPPEHAIRFAESLRKQPHAVQVSPGRRHWQLFLGLCEEAVARGNLVPDAFFAAMAIESGLGDGDEHRTIVVPEAIAQAFPLDLYESGDKVGARMAFKAAYPDKRRELGDKVLVSLGRNVEGRDHALRSAYQLGLIPAKKVIHHLPHLADDAGLAEAAGLPAPSDEPTNVIPANVIPLRT